MQIILSASSSTDVTKADIRKLEAGVRAAQKELTKAQKALDRALAKYAKQQATPSPKPAASSPQSGQSSGTRRELVTTLVKRGDFAKRADAKGIPIDELRAMVAKQASRPNSSSSRREQPNTSAMSSVDFKKHKVYDHKLMKGKKWHNALNANASVKKGIEGYWRGSIKPSSSAALNLPFPIRMPVAGYNKREFIEQLKELESVSSSAPSGRGKATDRWTGKNDNGAGEFVSRRGSERWRWPQGYMRYIKGGVPPTREFYKFVTGEDNPNLPSYPVVGR